MVSCLREGGTAMLMVADKSAQSDEIP